MSILQKIVIYLLIASVPLSVWPDVMSPCNGLQTTQFQAKAASGHVHSAMMMQTEAQKITMLGDSNLAPEMECCDDCVAICAAFAGSLAANAASYSDQYSNNHLPLNSMLNEFHTLPPPQAFFRPPIS